LGSIPNVPDRSRRVDKTKLRKNVANIKRSNQNKKTLNNDFLVDNVPPNIVSTSSQLALLCQW